MQHLVVEVVILLSVICPLKVFDVVEACHGNAWKERNVNLLTFVITNIIYLSGDYSICMATCQKQPVKVSPYCKLIALSLINGQSVGCLCKIVSLTLYIYHKIMPA